MHLAHAVRTTRACSSDCRRGSKAVKGDSKKRSRARARLGSAPCARFVTEVQENRIRDHNSTSTVTVGALATEDPDRGRAVIKKRRSGLERTKAIRWLVWLTYPTGAPAAGLG
jgi:hypothetical protein